MSKWAEIVIRHMLLLPLHDIHPLYIMINRFSFYKFFHIKRITGFKRSTFEIRLREHFNFVVAK